MQTGSASNPALSAELADMIVQPLELSTLRSVALLNRFWNEVVNRRLWKKVVVNAPRAGCPANANPPEIRAYLKRVCQAVTRYNRAACVRCVEFDVRQRLKGQGDGEDHALSALFVYFCSTLAACGGLKVLEIKARHHRSELADRLSARAVQDPFPFHLEELNTSLTIHDGLSDFLLQQTRIVKWSTFWLRPRGDVVPQLASALPGDALLSVHTLWSSASQARHVLPHRGIRNLELTDTDFASFNVLGDGPFETVEHLAFQAMANRDDLDTSLSNAVGNFARIFPNVKYLRICTHPSYWPSPEALSALGRFQQLECICWMGNTLFPNAFTPPQAPDDVLDELPEDWSLPFLATASVEAPTVKVVEVYHDEAYREGSAHIIWTCVYANARVKVKEDDRMTPSPTNHGDQVAKHTQWLWTCGMITVIAEEIVYADGRRTVDARITAEYENISEDDSSGEEDSMEE